jgi:hypothetical protein
MASGTLGIRRSVGSYDVAVVASPPAIGLSPSLPSCTAPRQHRTTTLKAFPETEYRNIQDPFLTCTRPRERVRHTALRGEVEATILGEKTFKWTGKLKGNRVLPTNPEGFRIEITAVGPL